MSQDAIEGILRKLGDAATATEIAALAKEMYPNLSLYAYVGNRLLKMSKWEVVKGIYLKDFPHNPKVWYLTDTKKSEGELLELVKARLTNKKPKVVKEKKGGVWYGKKKPDKDTGKPRGNSLIAENVKASDYIPA